MLRLLPIVVMILFAYTAEPQELSSSALDTGFHDMYNLQFGAAHQVFQDWEHAHEEDPLGPVADAAAYLFSEFDRLHILEMEFFTNDKSFETNTRLTPDPQVKQALFAALDRADKLAGAALARDPRDSNALFASVLTQGLRGDYLALIEKRNLQALSHMKDARSVAERLLAIDPARYDAYLAIGVENYLLSLKPAPLRWVLRLGGAETDKSTGLDRLRLTADKGHYLRPFARLLLAVAAMRDHEKQQARQLLQGLAEQFPQNRLYKRELAQIH